MQRYTIFFIIVNALHVSGGFSYRPEYSDQGIKLLHLMSKLKMPQTIFPLCHAITFVV